MRELKNILWRSYRNMDEAQQIDHLINVMQQLQEMCKELQISLFKIVNGKEKKKTKKDLHDNIKNYIHN